MVNQKIIHWWNKSVSLSNTDVSAVVSWEGCFFCRIVITFLGNILHFDAVNILTITIIYFMKKNKKVNMKGVGSEINSTNMFINCSVLW